MKPLLWSVGRHASKLDRRGRDLREAVTVDDQIGPTAVLEEASGGEDDAFAVGGSLPCSPRRAEREPSRRRGVPIRDSTRRAPKEPSLRLLQRNTAPPATSISKSAQPRHPYGIAKEYSGSLGKTESTYAFYTR